MPNIEIIQPTDADGYIREVYDQILESRGKIAEIYKVQSLNPRSIIRHLDLYMTLMYSKSPLTREQREMTGVVVSSLNKCEYSKAHHAEALMHYWKDEKRVQALTQKFRDAGLEEKDQMLCELAELTTLTPYSRKISGHIKKMKKKGFTDRAILDATLIISYFNFVNRIALNLEVELEKDQGGYKY